MALTHSQGQQAATLQSTANQGVGVQDSTANHGYNAGLIRIYSGSAPATANAAETGTKAAESTMNATAFGAASGLPSVITANSIANSTILSTQTAGYGRMTTGTSGTGFPTLEDGTLSTTQRRIMFAVGTSGSDMNFNTLSLVLNGTFSITSLTYTHPQ